MSKLFEPIKVGDLQLPNRIFMSPLTRCRSGESRVPNDLMREYYTQRAQAGLILTEATVVSPMGIGYAQTPGVYSEAQTEGWKKITDSVHKAGGRIFLQLWHVGRISDPIFLNGETPVAPSAIAALGHVSLVRPKRNYIVPRSLSIPEIKDIVEQFRKGAENAKKAGFDGVEIHGANGYLIDQFLQDGSNKRNDQYGGSLENRARFMLEVTDAVISVWGASRVGMHLAPRGDSHTMGDSNLLGTFSYVAEQLGKRKLAFLCSREHRGPDWIGPKLKKAFGGTYVANEGFTQQTAEQVLANGEADAVAFGQLFIANADLPAKFKTGGELRKPNMATFYSHGPEGYID